MSRPPTAFWVSLAAFVLGVVLIRVATNYGHEQSPGSAGRNVATIVLLVALVPLVAGAIRMGVEIVRLINGRHEGP